MAKFIYIADTHFGADPMGYQLQTGYPERLGEIFGALEAWIDEAGDIGFVLHGGDVVDQTTRERILHVEELMRLSVPVYVCLGNHDLTESGAVRTWAGSAPQFFPGGRPEFRLEGEGWCLHVVPNHWGAEPHYWRDAQDPQFSRDQLDWLAAGLAESPDATHILATHAPVFGIPPEQTGFGAAEHGGGSLLQTTVVDLTRRFPQLRCILGAHTHANMHVECEGVHYVTVSALVETPFEFKVIDVGDGPLRMRTLSLTAQVGFVTEYDFNKTYVQGRLKDRELGH